MCYSAQITAEYGRYVRQFGAELSLRDFVELFYHRQQDSRVKIPRALAAEFMDMDTDAARTIRALIEAFDAAQATTLEQELFKQRKRLADAERRLQTRTTKAALENRRIASAKIDWARGKLADLRRSEPNGEDARIFPGWYAPVMIREGGRAGGQADALPVPPGRQAGVLRPPVPRHLQRAARQPRRASGRACSASRTASWSRTRSTRTSSGTGWKAASCATARRPAT